MAGPRGGIAWMTRTFDILRLAVGQGTGQTSAKNLIVTGRVSGKMQDKSAIIQDHVGAPIVTTDKAIFLPRGTNIRVGDQLLDRSDGRRYRAHQVLLFRGPQNEIEVRAATGAT